MKKEIFIIVVYLLNKNLNNIFFDLIFIIWYSKLNRFFGLLELLFEKILYRRSILVILEDIEIILGF